MLVLMNDLKPSLTLMHATPMAEYMELGLLLPFLEGYPVCLIHFRLSDTFPLFSAPFNSTTYLYQGSEAFKG